MATAEQLRQQQIAQAEELFFSGPQKEGFAKDLFRGKFRAESVLPYPQPTPQQRAVDDETVAEVRKFAEEHIDAAKIDRESDIPQEVIRGLAELGVLGMCVSPEYGGRGFSQQSYCRVMEVIGGHCGSTAVFVNAHHSIGLRALELFGTQEQKDRWLRPLTTGEQLAAFALTEPEAGSDAANVQTTATPTEDGTGFLLNGEKRYITNGGIAGVLTVMARTPDEHAPEGRITAFLVTPDMDGFEVVEARMEKVSIRGTATGKLAFHDMFVPKENILGPPGKGLKVALTVLDYGRTTFGASCTGAAKFCVEKAIERARTRKQFGQTLGSFELVRQKIAHAAAETFAMESATYHTAAVIDSGAEDYMLETAMLKVFASESLWRIVNDTLQIYGGAGFFTDQPFERMMRDARLNLVGEGANDVLRSFIAMVGLRDLGRELEELPRRPWKAFRLLRTTPQIPTVERTRADLGTIARLEGAARQLARQIAGFSRACQRMLIRYREEILDRQCVQARLGDTATELFLASCVYARLCGMIESRGSRVKGQESSDGIRFRIEDRPSTLDSRHSTQFNTGLFYMQASHRRNQQRLQELTANDDEQQDGVARIWLQE